MKRIIHLSSVHARYDNRILIKECVSLSKNGYEVYLFIADGKGDENYKGVLIKDLGIQKSRLHRFFKIIPKILIEAIRSKASLYHFHDPELIPAGLILRMLGYKVIYDIHEDYITSIKQKHYLNPYIARILAFIFNFFEKITAIFFELIIAEKYYKERFPRAVPILNYPVLDDEYPFEQPNIPVLKSKELLYSGNVTLDRGALQHARILKELEDVRITSIGKCKSEVAQKMLQEADSGAERLTIIGLETFVRPEEINEKYREKEWLVGLALFPKTEHYVQKELTKFFEYMKFGLPILCTDFPLWKKIVDEGKCGIAVDPDNISEINDALEQLYNDVGLFIQMRNNGMKLYKTKFNWDQEEKKLLSVYKRILKKE